MDYRGRFPEVLNAAEVSNMMKTGKCAQDLMSRTTDLGKNSFGERRQKEAQTGVGGEETEAANPDNGVKDSWSWEGLSSPRHSANT